MDISVPVESQRWSWWFRGSLRACYYYNYLVPRALVIHESLKYRSSYRIGVGFRSRNDLLFFFITVRKIKTFSRLNQRRILLDFSRSKNSSITVIKKILNISRAKLLWKILSLPRRKINNCSKSATGLNTFFCFFFLIRRVIFLRHARFLFFLQVFNISVFFFFFCKTS